MIIKDGDFYSALTHLKEAREMLYGKKSNILEQIEAAEIALKSAITDELDENGEIKVFCENPLLQWSKEDVERVAEREGISLDGIDAMSVLEEAVEENADSIGELINTSILNLLNEE